MIDKKEELGSGINPKLTTVINQLLEDVFGSPTAKAKKRGRPKNEPDGIEPEKEIGYTLEDKLKVLDRALKLEALRLKVSDTDDGAGFSVDGTWNRDV